MTTMECKNLWQTVFSKGYETRKSGIDGQKAWQALKNEYEESAAQYDCRGTRIEKLCQEIGYNKCEDDTDHKKVTIRIAGAQLSNRTEIEHFIIQHFRIPLMQNYQLSLSKLLQIAYNAGQARVEFDNESYSSDVKCFYESNMLDDIETYVK